MSNLLPSKWRISVVVWNVTVRIQTSSRAVAQTRTEETTPVSSIGTGDHAAPSQWSDAS